MNPKSDIDAFCKGCYHLDEYLPACIYILHTHEKRPCAAGEGCKVKISPEEWRKFVQGQKDQEDRARKREQAKRGGANKPKPKRMVWTPEACEELREMQREGRTAREIAQIFKTTPSAIYSQLRQIGCSNPASKPSNLRGRPKVWTQERTEELLRLRALGMTHRQIGERLGMTTKAIETRLRVLREKEKRHKKEDAV